jgi:hypothetical protein
MSENPVINGKTRITIRIDNVVLDWFRAEVNSTSGGNYQTLINQALHEYISQQGRFDEADLRRIIREELATSRKTLATFKANTTVSR